MLAALAALALVLPSALALESVAPASLQEVKYQYRTEYFQQRVDHFSLSNGDVFKQRYLVNDSFWEADGPIFFYTGNEGDIEAFAQNSGFMWDIAPEFNALLVFAEHRYYGTSLPYGKDSLKPDPSKVGYLTSEQALADFAALLLDLKSGKDLGDSPVIAFGGSYGGMLAAWFRIKFPHVCDGAIAASAPVAQFSAPCDAFGRIVTADYAAQGEECAGVIRKSWDAINNVTKTDEGLKWLKSEFRLCEDLKSESVPVLKDYLTNLWTNVAMMDYPYPTTFLMPLPGDPVRAVCKKIMLHRHDEDDDDKGVLSSLFQGVSVYFNHTGAAKCLELSDPDQIGSSMWDFQACTEMVMPMCYDGRSDMFEPTPWNYTAYAESCKARWKVDPRPRMAHLMYGERKLQAASNIIFSNGLLDPWSSGGVLKTVSKSVVSLIIPEGAHHLDLRGSDPADPPSVVKARNVERQYIGKWMKEAYEKSKVEFAHSGPDAASVVVGRKAKKDNNLI